YLTCSPGIDATVVLEIGLTDTLVVTLSGPTAKALAQINHGAGRIKLRDTNATQDILRFQEKITALALVLRSLDELIRGSDGNKLTATQDLVDNIVKCSSALTNLKDKINPETTQRRMRKWGLQALKWPLARSEVDFAIMELEWYKTTFALSLQVDQ
ncbi:hypothetical protein PENNAL_c0938G11567, partial [Penicillium nalgiovense]